MPAHSRNVSLISVQILLWLFAVSAAVGLLDAARAGTIMISVVRRVTTMLLAATAALLIRRRNRLAFPVILALAGIAVVPPILFGYGVPVIPILVWAAIFSLVRLNWHEFVRRRLV